jgi:hypothetical protein
LTSEFFERRSHAVQQRNELAKIDFDGDVKDFNYEALSLTPDKR